MVTDMFNIEHSLLKSRVKRLNKYMQELKKTTKKELLLDKN